MKKSRILAAVISLAITVAVLPTGLAVFAAESDSADPPVGTPVNELPIIGPQTTGEDSGGSYGWNVLYPNGDLYTIGNGRTLMARNVESYAGIYFSDGNYVGNNLYNEGYLIQSPDDTLWEWRWDAAEQKSSQKEIVRDVRWYSSEGDYAILNDGSLIALNAPDQILMDDVATVVYDRALQKDGTLRKIGGNQNGAIIDTDVTGVFGEYGEFYTKADGTYYYSDYEETKTRIADFEANEIVTNYGKDYLIYDGTLYKVVYEYGEAHENGYIEITNGFEGFWAANGNWCIANGKICNMDGEEIALPFPQEEIAKYDGAFVLKTDGTLWQCTYGHGSVEHDTPQLVMTHVTEFAADSDRTCIAVRTDGSIWYSNDWQEVLQFKQVAGPLESSDLTDPPVGADAAVLPMIGNYTLGYGYNDPVTGEPGASSGCGEGFNVLYPDGSLYVMDVRENKKTLVAENVTAYQGVNNYCGEELYATNYLIKDKQNVLWNWGYDEASQERTQEKLAENVQAFTPRVALLANGDLIDLKTSQVIIQDVKEISYSHYFLEPHSSEPYVLLNDGTLLTFIGSHWEEPQVIDTGVSEIANSWLIDAWGNRYPSRSCFYIKDGATYEGGWSVTEKLCDFPATEIQEMYYHGFRYAVKDGNALYECNTYEHINTLLTEDFKEFSGDGYRTNAGTYGVLNGTFSNAGNTLPFSADEIDKVSGGFVLKTDGTLWKLQEQSATFSLTNSGDARSADDPVLLLTHVADFSSAMYGYFDDQTLVEQFLCIAVRTDGSVWGHDTQDTSGAFTMLAEPLEGTQTPETPPVDGGTTNPGGSQTPSDDVEDGGDSANPGTGDSLTALSAGTVAAAAAGVLLVTRKKVR